MQKNFSGVKSFYFEVGDQCDFYTMVKSLKKFKPKVVLFYNDSQDSINSDYVNSNFPIFQLAQKINFENLTNFYLNIFKEKNRKLKVYYFY